MIMPDETRYGAGYRDGLNHTLNHINNRIREEQAYAHTWINKTEYIAYIRALTDIRDYLTWVLEKENS